ncbi:unnamed protein product [Schistocephalus solidus]|uniref:H15 domain-containing protein n=1 Tax=Schistocephalus solidus TaxID=70667 RepID=A0A183T5L9_SCHSO|nr:unnamed protein product [Schistocephalus solidus]
MSEPVVSAPAAHVGAPAKKVKTAKKPSKSQSHPPFANMVVTAIKDLKERNGSSRQAIVKHIKSHHPGIAEKVVEVQVRRALISGAKAGRLIQTKGVGASGSFKLSEKAKAPAGITKVAKPKKTTKAKTAVAKPKKASAKPKKTPTKPKKASAKPKKAAAKPGKAAPKVHKSKTPKKKVVAAVKPKKPTVKKTPKK